jgi:hypothetical protein
VACTKALRWVSRVDTSILCAHPTAITPVLPEDARYALHHCVNLPCYEMIDPVS